LDYRREVKKMYNLAIYQKLLEEKNTMTVARFMDLTTSDQPSLCEMLIAGYGQMVLQETEDETVALGLDDNDESSLAFQDSMRKLNEISETITSLKAELQLAKEEVQAAKDELKKSKV
jgi:hypothetical protein